MTCLSGLCQRRGSLEFAVAFAFLATLASAQTPGLDPAGLRAINVEVSAATYRGRSATRVIERQASPEVAGGESIAILPGPDFVKGVIELDVVGRLAQGAGEAARGFVGLAFDVTEGGSRFKSFYLRPTNGRATDQLRRNHSTQYTSIPEHPWNRLRKEEPGFEGGLSRWVVEGRDAVSIHRTATSHGAVLRLQSNGDVHALIRGSEAWGNLAIEGELLFPDGADSYLGVAYNFRRRGPRTDFGLLYLKYGARVYLQPNPHRDYNVSRKLYPDYVAPLSGSFKTRVGEWQKFRVEVVDGVSHFYAGETSTPQLTFDVAEPGPGQLGLQPRSVGGDVFVDNIRVSAIDRFSYGGPPQPGPVAKDPSPLSWEVLGPFPATKDGVAVAAGTPGWRPFPLDPRAAIETGRVIDYHGPNTVAYFKTVVRAREASRATLRLSTIDDLALWLNGRFQGFIPRQENAWADHWSNPAHKGDEVPLHLLAGENSIVLRVRGGTYASGGFFARVETHSAR